MVEEKEEVVDKMEQEEKEEKALIADHKERIRKEQEELGLVENPGQKFSENGMLECTVKRADEVLTKIAALLNSLNLPGASVNRRIVSTSEQNKVSPLHPFVSFVGEEIVIRIVVPPTDKYGNDGRVWVDKELAERWSNINEIDTAEIPEDVSETK